MSHEHKTGQLRFEGAEPMSFVESDGVSSIQLSTDEETASRILLDTIRSYLKTAESLVATKYHHLEQILPAYLVRPGNVLIAVCTDGIVIRYESKSGEKRNLAVTVMREDIAHAALVLSQNLVQVQQPGLPITSDDKLGVEIRLAKVSPEGEAHDFFSTRIWLQVTNTEPQQLLQSPAKPYCLLSVRNSLEMEIHGEIVGDANSVAVPQPFIARSQVRLSAGWECIEVFPGLNLDAWKPEYAPLWAENDILGAALVAHTRDSQLSNLDPRAAVRRQYGALLAEFKQLIDSEPEREQVLQTFLQSNPALLCPTHVQMWPKLPLGAKVTDFVFRDAAQEYLLVELERSTLPLFRQDGHATAELTHAHGQIMDWKRYLEDNLQTVQRELGLHGITPNPSGLLVIGRSSSLLPENRRKIQTMMNESPKLRVMTYDDVYENAKAVLENLLGPMWDAGGSTQIFYPNSR